MYAIGSMESPYEIHAALLEADRNKNLPMKVRSAGVVQKVEPSVFLPQGLFEVVHDQEAYATAWGDALFYYAAQGWQGWPSQPALSRPKVNAEWLHPGAWVLFQGLKAALELNGQEALVERWDLDSGRWVVRTCSGEAKFAKVENLMPLRLPQAPSTATATAPNTAAGSAGRFFAAAPAVWPVPPGLGPQPRGGFGAASTATGTGSQRSSISGWASDESTEASDGIEVSGATGGDWPHERSTPQTTVMMRNIPVEYSRTMLVDLLNHEGFCGSYDLVYLPMNFGSMQGFGYAFINLVSVEEAFRFRDHFEGFSGWQVGSDKTCEVSWSNVLQGRQAHIERYRNSPLMHPSVPDEFKPACFVGSRRVPFPAPTQRIKAPRHRKECGPALGQQQPCPLSTLEH